MNISEDEDVVVYSDVPGMVCIRGIHVTMTGGFECDQSVRVACF